MLSCSASHESLANKLPSKLLETHSEEAHQLVRMFRLCSELQHTASEHSGNHL